MKAYYDKDDRGYISVHVNDGVHLLEPFQARSLVKELQEAIENQLLSIKDELECLCRQQCSILFNSLHINVSDGGWNYQFWISVTIGEAEIIFETWDNQIAVTPRTRADVLQRVTNEWIEHIKQRIE